MKERQQQRESRTVLGEGRFLRLVSERGWERAERTVGSTVVAVIAVSAAGELLLTEQFRQALNRRVLDLPAGLAGDSPESADESLETAARRELEEETGFRATRLQRWLTLPTSPGLTSETVTLFHADQVQRVAEGGGDDSEQIQVVCARLDGIDEWLMQQDHRGTRIDPKVFVALYWLHQHAR